MQVPQAVPFTLPRATVPSLTNSQIKSSAMADDDSLSTKRKTSLMYAMAPWHNVPAESLTNLGNNFHRKGRLAQLRDWLSPEQSGQQVRDIFTKRHSGA